jgi:hypothetical protein
MVERHSVAVVTWVRFPSGTPELNNFMEKEKDPREEYANWKAAEEPEEVVEISAYLPRKTDGKIDYSEIVKQGQENFNKHIKHVSIKALLMYIKSGGIDIMKVKGISKAWKSKLKRKNEMDDETEIINAKSSFVPEGQAGQVALQELLRRIESGELQD